MAKPTAGSSMTKKRQPQRMLGRLVTTFAILLVAALLIATSLSLWLRVNDIESNLVKETIVKANIIATQVAPSLDFDEPSEAQTVLKHFSADPSVVSVAIENLEGSIFASYGNMSIPTGFEDDKIHEKSSGALLVRIPVTVDGQVVGTVWLQASMSAMRAEVRRYFITNTPIMLLVIVLTILLMLKTARVITRPVSSLAGVAAEIAENANFSLRATKFANDEIGLLTDEFNAMLEMIESQSDELKENHQRLAISERLESLGLLAGGVAHDLNNILGPLVAMPDLIMSKLDKDHEARDGLMMISKASRRAAVVIQDLLSLARSGTYKLESVDLNEIIEECVASPAVEQRLAEVPNCQLKLRLDDTLFMSKGSEPHLTQLILNLVINAIEAMGQLESHGALVLRTQNVRLKEPLEAYETIPAGHYTMLSVKDQGPGMAPSALKRIFEPFYTSKKMGSSGSGLGLSVVYGVVHDHGGYLDVISQPGQGAEFRVFLRRDSSVKFMEAAESVMEIDARILIVDDLDTQRLLTESLLQSIGYLTVSAEHGRQAIEILNEEPDIDLMIVDMIMEEGFDGLDTIREALKIRPGLPCIIATGFSQNERVKAALELGAHACLNKPFTVGTLSKAVNKARKASARSKSDSLEEESTADETKSIGMFFKAAYSQNQVEKTQAEPMGDTTPTAASAKPAPAVASRSDEMAAEQSSDPDQTTILVVDDDPAIREIATVSISRLGYNVLGADSAAEVLTLLDGNTFQPSLILSDMNMPGGISGLEIAGKVVDDYPDCKVIIMSGLTAADISNKEHTIKDLHFLAKPFSLASLNQKVKDVLAAPAA